MAKYGKKSPSIPTSKLTVKVKKTLEDGNCFYSAVYRSLKDKNLLEMLYTCIPMIRSSNEKEFINKLRIFTTIEGERSIRQIFKNYTINKLPKKTFYQIIKYIGSIKNTLKRYYENDLFKEENTDIFVDDIKKVILTDKNWAGNLEVVIISDKFFEKCKIRINLFNTLKDAVIKATKDKNLDINDVYLLNQNEAHWEYINIE